MTDLFDAFFKKSQITVTDWISDIIHFGFTGKMH